MGTIKSISLGDGQRVNTDYDGLKKMLKLHHIHERDTDTLLKKHFPDEYKLDISKGNHATQRKRWDAWFSEENQSAHRKLIVPNPEGGEWQRGDGTRIHNNGHANLLAKAQRAMVREFEGQHRNNVTDFSGWIFELDHRSGEASMSDGKVGERLVQKTKQRFTSPYIFNTDWDLISLDNLTDQQKGQPISLLTVNDRPLCGKPDYVFYNKKTETVLIVEVKTSSAKLPPDSWPNLRAQLWAYAHLDFVIERAKHVILIGEVWVRVGEHKVRLSRTYQWDMSDTQFCKENEDLFACYQQYASR